LLFQAGDMGLGGWDQKPPGPEQLPRLFAEAATALKEERYFDSYNTLSQAANAFAHSFNPPFGSAEIGLMMGQPGEFLDIIVKDEPRVDLQTLGRLWKLRGESLHGLGSTKGALTMFHAAERALPDDCAEERAEAVAKRRKVENHLESARLLRTPVTVLTGSLGSGKTTLLNRILRSHHGKRIAVIENEFGEVGIDNSLVEMKSTEETIVEMNNGCICCTVRGDLIAALKKLLRQAKEKAKPFDFIVIETTGLADPAPVAQTFMADAFVQKFTRLDGIVTVVDAKHIIQHLDDEKPEGVENEALEQIAFADRVLLNKCDLVAQAQLEEVDKRIRSINRVVQIQRTVKCEVDLDFILGIHGFDLDRTLANDATFLDDGGEHQHDDRVSSVGIDLPGQVDICKLDNWLGDLLRDHGKDIYRAKGVLAVRGRKERFVFQAVHMQQNSGPQAAWEDGEERRCKMVFIGKNLQREMLVEGFMRCYELCDEGTCKPTALMQPNEGSSGLG